MGRVWLGGIFQKPEHICGHIRKPQLLDALLGPSSALCPSHLATVSDSWSWLPECQEPLEKTLGVLTSLSSPSLHQLAPASRGRQRTLAVLTVRTWGVLRTEDSQRAEASQEPRDGFGATSQCIPLSDLVSNSRGCSSRPTPSCGPVLTSHRLAYLLCPEFSLYSDPFQKLDG